MQVLPRQRTQRCEVVLGTVSRVMQTCLEIGDGVMYTCSGDNDIVVHRCS